MLLALLWLGGCGLFPTKPIPPVQIKTVEVPIEIIKPLPAPLTAPLEYPPALPVPLTFAALMAQVEALYALVDRANADRKAAAALSSPTAPTGGTPP